MQSSSSHWQVWLCLSVRTLSDEHFAQAFSMVDLGLVCDDICAQLVQGKHFVVWTHGSTTSMTLAVAAVLPKCVWGGAGGVAHGSSQEGQGGAGQP